MNRPREDVGPPSLGAALPLMLGFTLAGIAVIVLSLLTLGFVGVVIAVVVGLVAMIALQYLLWGWWLGRFLREDSESEKGLRQVEPTSCGPMPGRGESTE